MQFIAVLGAFIKSIPAVTDLMKKLLDFIQLQQELQHQKEVNEQMRKEMEQLRAAISAAQSPSHDNTALNNLFNGIKQ